jgi:hypothetical protein
METGDSSDENLLEYFTDSKQFIDSTLKSQKIHTLESSSIVVDLVFSFLRKGFCSDSVIALLTLPSVQIPEQAREFYDELFDRYFQSDRRRSSALYMILYAS